MAGGCNQVETMHHLAVGPEELDLVLDGRKIVLRRPDRPLLMPSGIGDPVGDMLSDRLYGRDRGHSRIASLASGQFGGFS